MIRRGRQGRSRSPSPFSRWWRRVATAEAGILRSDCDAAARRSAPCTLGRAQRRAIARSLADIRRLRRIQSPLQTFSEHGAPNENTVTGKFLLDLGSAKLPVNVRSHLIHLAKTAADLCGDCSQGLEAAEPFLGNRGEDRCG